MRISTRPVPLVILFANNAFLPYAVPGWGWYLDVMQYRVHNTISDSFKKVQLTPHTIPPLKRCTIQWFLEDLYLFIVLERVLCVHV